MRALFEKVPAEAGHFFLVKRRADPAFEFCWHYHREFELTLIGQSQGRRFVGDHIAEYGPGDLCFLGPQLPHTWCSHRTSPAPHEAVVVQFGDDLLGPGRLGSDGLQLGPVRELLARSARGLCFGGPVRDEVAGRMLRLGRLSPLRRLAELLVILDTLARADAQVLSSRTFVPQLRPGALHPVDKVCRYLNDRFLERVPLAEAARVLAMSPSAFSRFFRRTTGKTFTGYLNELRIGHACRLLIDTERGVADVAAASGFTNLSHFNRLFLRTKRMRPSQFRREHRRYVEQRATA